MTIPVGSIIMFHGAIANAPTDFNLCDGGAHDGYTTPDMRSRFVYGANVDGDVDSRAGATTHTHTSSATGSVTAHDHTYGVSWGADDSSSILGAGVAAQWSGAGHGHSGGDGGSTGAGGVHSHTVPATGTGSSLPLYIKAFYIMNTANASIIFGDLPVGAITAYASATIPEKWQLADGTNSTLDLRDRFVYGATADGDVGDTGGANTHTHTNATSGSDGAHDHTGGSISVGDDASAVTGNSGGTNASGAYGLHGHSGSGGIDSVNAHTHGLPALNSATNLPRYIKLYYIEKTVA